MIPIHDDNPTTIRPVVTIALIAVNALVFLWELGLPPGGREEVFYALGVVPAVLFGEARLSSQLGVVPAEITVLTSMFLHGGWMHWFGNQLYFWILGNKLQEACGQYRFHLF